MHGKQRATRPVGGGAGACTRQDRPSLRGNAGSFLGKKLSALARRSTMTKKILTLLLIGSGLALSACNTVKGAGEDIESVGNARP
jgi:predicted small secreted protein